MCRCRYTSCDAINCWIEPRCTVDSVDGKIVKLKQADNTSCFHRLCVKPAWGSSCARACGVQCVCVCVRVAGGLTATPEL